jgi:outer membrane protein
VRSHFRILLAAALLAASCTAAHAAAPAATPPSASDTLRLTLDDAVRRALTFAPDARVARATEAIAGGQVLEALSAALPQITGSVVYDRKFASPFESLSGDTLFGPIFSHSSFAAVHNWTAQLTASQTLWSGGRIGAGISGARHVRGAARATRDESLADLALAVRASYLEAAYAHDVQVIAEDALAQARAHLEQVTLFRKQGSRSEYDLLQAQVDAANQEPQTVGARNAAEQAMLQLRRLLDLPLDRPLALLTPLAFEGGMVPVLTAPSADGATRSAIRGAEDMVQARRQSLRYEAAGRWPSLVASATVAHQAYPTDWMPRRHDFVAAVDGSVKLEWPLFQGFRTFGTVQRATAELRQAEAERDRTREGVALEIEQARQEVQRALTTLVARRGTAALAQRAHYLATVRWRNGLSTQLEVSDARLQMQTAEVNQVAAVKDYRLALLRLERVTGQPLALANQSLDALTTPTSTEGAH